MWDLAKASAEDLLQGKRASSFFLSVAQDQLTRPKTEQIFQFFCCCCCCCCSEFFFPPLLSCSPSARRSFYHDECCPVSDVYTFDSVGLLIDTDWCVDVLAISITFGWSNSTIIESFLSSSWKSCWWKIKKKKKKSDFIAYPLFVL